MRMRGVIFLVVNLAVSSAFSTESNGPEIIESGGDKDLLDANHGSDDIREESKEVQRSAITSAQRLWESPVPYVLDKNLDMSAKGVTLKALEQFRLKSCIDFKPRDSEVHYINVQKLSGCFSYIGKSQPGQDLSIGDGCDELSTVEHEFLHALGFYHEQSRPDRDEFLTIAFENILAGYENNFQKVNEDTTTTNGVAYDYWSVMHYGSYAFTNGSGRTMITKDPAFQDIIGQRLEMSPSDILELNLHYKCNSTVAFQMFCGFSNDTMCNMNRCAQSGSNWEMVMKAMGGPSSDHTNLPTGRTSNQTQNASYFMHASTALNKAGDSAWLETHRMATKRACNIQCLQFYYHHSGNESDMLNIWLREFQDESDSRGTLRLIGQITGPRTSHWQLHHVSLNATKSFQVEFEARTGAGSSSGGFSIDDINLYEVECPHVAMQVDDIENLLRTSSYGTTMYSSRQYSSGGYAYQVGLRLLSTYVGVFVRLVSGRYDDQLTWPVAQRQVTFHLLDQRPRVQLQMTKQRSIVSDQSTTTDGTLIWGNPRMGGSSFVDDNNETIFAGPSIGRNFFTSLEEMKTRDFIKGGSAVFAFSFDDLSPLMGASALPCPRVRTVQFANPPQDVDRAPCSPRTVPTSGPTPETPQTLPPSPPQTPPQTSPQTPPPSPPQTPPQTSPQTPPPSPPQTPPQTSPPSPPQTPPQTPPPSPPQTPPPSPPQTPRPSPPVTWTPRPSTPPTPRQTTEDDDSIFGFSPSMVASPVLTLLLLVLMLLMP